MFCITAKVSAIPTTGTKIVSATRGSDDYMQCVRAMRFYENKYGLPSNMLYAISVVESGEWNEDALVYTPHPWTLNVEGKPYFFRTKEEATKFLKQVIASGKTNVDIGCAQINWHYHGHYFKKPENLLNPIYNIAYAAYFLTKNFYDTNSWHSAISQYHSKTEELGKEYLKKVSSIWKKVTHDEQYRKLLLPHQKTSNNHIRLQKNGHMIVFAQNSIIPSNDKGNDEKNVKTIRQLVPNAVSE
ncbi:hypothetical protein MIDIC_240003 [Alphaproteobacteria bacterium]